MRLGVYETLSMTDRCQHEDVNVSKACSSFTTLCWPKVHNLVLDKSMSNLLR